MNDTIIASFMGRSIGLGLLTTVITQVVKQLETIPWVAKIPGVQWIINQVTAGNVVQIRLFAGFVAILLNLGSVIMSTHSFPPMAMIVSTIGSVFVSIGGYDLIFSGDKRKI